MSKTTPNNRAPDNKTMRAVLWEGKPFHMAVRDVPKPRIMQDSDALVRITTAAICGTDLHTFHGLFGGSDVPYPMGHEGVGVVVEVGKDVQKVKVGDRVVVADVDSEMPLLAPGFGNFAGSLGGCQAEFIRVPAADTDLLVIPQNPMRDLDYVLMSDIWPTAWTGLDFAGFQPGDSVTVFGAGPVGLLCAFSAQFRGASKVFSVDHVPARLDVAKSIGAIPIDFTKGSPSNQILAILPAGTQRVVDCFGYECLNEKLKPQENFILSEAVKVAAFNGGIGIIGVYLDLPPSAGQPRADTIPGDITFPIGDFWIKNLSMRGGIADPKLLWPMLMALIESGRAKPSFVFSQEIGIEKAPQGYVRFDRHLETKIAIRFPWEFNEPVHGFKAEETVEETRPDSMKLVNGNTESHGSLVLRSTPYLLRH